MIYAVVEELTVEQWDLVVETWETARSSRDGLLIVKWSAPTPEPLAELETLTPAEAITLMQEADWQEA